tara:strand:- start:1317 stop:2138 length:822 start_codon:yes stop_codon:yes gene_type:complete
MILSYVNFIINNIDRIRPTVVDFMTATNDFKRLPFRLSDNRGSPGYQVMLHAVSFCKSNGGCKGDNLLMRWESGKNNNTPNGFNANKIVGVTMEGIFINNNISIRIFKNGKIAVKLGLSKSKQFENDRQMNNYLNGLSRDIVRHMNMEVSRVDVSNVVATGISLFYNEFNVYRIKNLLDFCRSLLPYLSRYKYRLVARPESNKKQLEKYQLRSDEDAPTIGIFKTGTCDMMNISSISEAKDIERIMKRAFREINPIVFKKRGSASAPNIRLFD